MVACRLGEDEPSPVDAGQPSNQVHSCQKLEEANDKLCFVNACITKAGTQHGAHSWEEDVQAKADVGPEVLQGWHVGCQLKRSLVLGTCSEGTHGHLLEAVIDLVLGDLEGALVSTWTTLSIWSLSTHFLSIYKLLILLFKVG